MPFRGASHDLDVSFDNSIIVSGLYAGTLFFGASASPAVGSSDLFAAKLTPDGNLLWSRKPGGTGTEYVFRIHSGRCGQVFGAATVRDPINFGGGDLVDDSTYGVAVVKYRQ